MAQGEINSDLAVYLAIKGNEATAPDALAAGVGLSPLLG